jgi:WD40 repeat protein
MLAYSDIKSINLLSLEKKILLGSLEGHQDTVRSICFSPNGEKLCSASEDNTIRLWDLETRQCEAILLGDKFS